MTSALEETHGGLAGGSREEEGEARLVRRETPCDGELLSGVTQSPLGVTPAQSDVDQSPHPLRPLHLGPRQLERVVDLRRDLGSGLLGPNQPGLDHV